MKIRNILFGLVSLAYFTACDPSGVPSTSDTKDSANVSVEDVVEPVRVDSFFGLVVDTTTQSVVDDVIPKNKTLSDVLTKYGVSVSMIHQLAEQSKSQFDVRKIRQGNPYHVLQTKDSLPVTTHFVYEINHTDYIVYTFQSDSILVQKGQKRVEKRERIVSGTIETSLWNAVVGQNVPFELALVLSNIYAWNIDFFGLQKGDHFMVKYDEIWCDSTFIRVDTVYGAVFNHCGVDFHAIPFVQRGRCDYFDYDGNSLRKAFLKAPLSYSRISSSFSNSRFHPVLKIFRPHHGVDYAAPLGTPVSSIGDGKVIYKAFSGGGGNTVKIQHNSTYTTVYMHLSKFGNISVGKMVKQGEVIGYVGSTGTSTGPHLDFRVYENGSPINPLTLKSPPVEPIDSVNRERYIAVRDSVLQFFAK